ncbi:dipeptide/oligopeptide ABC transporter permease protein (plasmid) [Rhizobium gallicum bv. gallicum R602sp]|uniref:Dipeptide/oligopeptide ABC transporter permease protein n=2 Tax=Rhizobium gallicum TaxID=56730 RepID=A0A0B4XAU3_9HYPH|nr:dipeptide/oligopeptide ABC transporter permease protein [Rhizobium gallicum bv. gallicum R602sp]
MPGLSARLALRALNRLLMIAVVLWGAATIAFVVVKLIPGDPVGVISGGDNIVDGPQREAIARQFGLDQPIAVQYATYVRRALTGDFGTSYQYRQPVTRVIVEAGGYTVQLAATAMLIAVVAALISAIATAGQRAKLRAALIGFELIALSTPIYWIGIVLLTLFSFKLQWFPVTGSDGFRSLVLPAVTLSLPLGALLSQVLRDGLEDSLTQPFAMTVRMRGVGETILRIRHGLRHAALAASTLTGTLLASVLGGSILTETVFGRPGIGQITLQAIKSRDMPMVLGLVMFSALIFVIVNIIVDALYLVIDPRLRRASHE